MTNIITIDFNGGTVLAIDQGDHVAIPVGPVCAAIGIDTRSQRKAIMADPVLSAGVSSITLPTGQGPQEMVCLRLDLIHGWLFRINPNKVSKEARPKLIAFQVEGYKVLFDHFYARKCDRIEKQPEPEKAAQETTAMKLALVRMARQTHGIPASARLWLDLGLPTNPEMFQVPRQRSLRFKHDPILDAGGPAAEDEVH